MMKLYYAETLNPRKVCALARYLGSPVEFVRVDMAKGQHRTADFLAMNPNGKVPVLQTDNGTLWESNAILCHLAREAGSDLWPAAPADQIDLIRWLSWDSQHFSRHGGTLYFEYLIKPAIGLGGPDEKTTAESIAFMRRYLAVLDAHLQRHDFMIADRLTVADFAIGISLPYAEAAHIPVNEFAAVQRWHERLSALPGWLDPFPAARAAA
jgi:glutathione S-transferase